MAKTKAPTKNIKAGLKTPPKRQIKHPQYKSFKMSKRIRHIKPPLTGSVRLFVLSLKILSKKWRLFGGIVLVYLILTMALVKLFDISSNIGELRESIAGFFEGSNAQLLTSLTLFSVLLGNSGSAASDVAGAYQTTLFVIISLALIWALRQSLAAKAAAVTVRDAFYKGMYPMVPFILVLLVFFLQLLPLAAANFLYVKVIVGGLAVTAIEIGLWVVLMFLLAILSLYMITSSVFALYVVTLPDVSPLTALRSARDLVRYRRWSIMRKVLFLPVALLILAAVIIVPIILVSPVVAEVLFFVLSMLSLAIMHAYFYSLYRELL